MLPCLRADRAPHRGFRGANVCLMTKLIRFHGVLALNAEPRDAIVPSPPENTTEHAADHARMSWARLLERVFDVDIESIRRRSVVGLNNSPSESCGCNLQFED